jgi:hypothetical protein
MGLSILTIEGRLWLIFGGENDDAGVIDGGSKRGTAAAAAAAAAATGDGAADGTGEPGADEKELGLMV